MMKLMPDINIFILSQVPQKEKKEKKKENPLAEALAGARHGEMMGTMSAIVDKLRRLPMTSHVGGG